MPNPATQTTLAVTIAAPPEKAWPWLVQMGADRGGFYTYLLVENALLRLGVRNADRIHPEWQEIRVGDRFRYVPRYYPGPPLPGPVAAGVHRNRALLMCLGERRAGHCTTGSWNFVLEPKGEGSTRLLLRSRASSVEPYVRVLGPGIYVMDRGMLLGIPQKAEGKSADRSLAERASFACVSVAALGSVMLLLPKRRWPWSLAIASMGACLTTLVFFAFYPSVVCSVLLVLFILAALL